MNKPTGKLAYAYNTIRNMEVIIEKQKLVIEQLQSKNQQVCSSVETLTRDRDSWRRVCEALQERLAEIGDFAHHKSSGPTVPDGYWDIRNMAYGATKP